MINDFGDHVVEFESIIMIAYQFKIDSTYMKDASVLVTSIVLAIDFRTFLLVNPLFTTTTHGANVTNECVGYKSIRNNRCK